MKCTVRHLEFNNKSVKDYFIQTKRFLIELYEDENTLRIHNKNLSPLGTEIEVPLNIMKKLVIGFFTSDIKRDIF